MLKPAVDRHGLKESLLRLAADFTEPASVYLIGETSQLAEGWRRQSERIEIATTGGLPSAETEIEIVNESPGELIPLPVGYEERARPVGLFPDDPRFLHFDPYSVSFRFIARGDEPDYHLVLSYLHHGWITVEGMDELLEELLPRFTERTIGQDASEFRRRYHGLLQMRRAILPGTIHRPQST